MTRLPPFNVADYLTDPEATQAYIDELRSQLDLAIKMREAQKRYFEYRSRLDLVVAKALEKEFDAAILLDRSGDDHVLPRSV